MELWKKSFDIVGTDNKTVGTDNKTDVTLHLVLYPIVATVSV